MCTIAVICGVATEAVTVLFGCYVAGATWNCCHLGTSSVYTIQPCSSLQCHIIRSYIRRMHVCLAVTCLMRVLQNCQDLLPATAVARWWNGCRNKSQHKNKRRKLFCRSCRDSNLRLFDRESVVLILNHPLSPIHTMQLTGIFRLQPKIGLSVRVNPFTAIMSLENGQWKCEIWNP